VVFSDGAYGNVKRIQQAGLQRPHHRSDLHNPDFVKLGESFGIAAERAKSPTGTRRGDKRVLWRVAVEPDRLPGRPPARPLGLVTSRGLCE